VVDLKCFCCLCVYSYAVANDVSLLTCKSFVINNVYPGIITSAVASTVVRWLGCEQDGAAAEVERCHGLGEINTEPLRLVMNYDCRSGRVVVVGEGWKQRI
jgi:hypothetical protein